MGITNFFKSIFGLGGSEDQQREAYAILCEQKTEFQIRQLAFAICVNRIARLFSKCEFRTYKNGKEQKDALYYLLNVSPNDNQNATQFWNKFVFKLYTDQKVLILPQFNRKGEMKLYVADSFSLDDSQAFGEHVFKSIVIGQLTMKKEYRASQVYYFTMEDGRVKAYLDDTMRMYQQLISSAYKYYKRSNGIKMKVGVDQIQTTGVNGVALEDVLQEDIKTFLENDDVALPEYKGYKIEPFDMGQSKDSRDLKAMIDDALEITSKALLIPANSYTGEVTDTSKAMNDTLTLNIDPLAMQVAKELNRKTFAPKDYLAGTKIVINTNTIKHFDIVDIANALDKLISCGAKTINDINRILGEPEIDEEWANTHFITKNYQPMEDYLNLLESPASQIPFEENPDASG